MGLRKTVLCIDEYAALLDTLAPVLQPFGYDVRTAHNMSEAYEVAAQCHPDAILLEYRLCPGCAGNRGKQCAAGRFHADSPAAKMLVWCADGSVMEHVPPCAQAVFMKPLPPPELAAHLTRVLGK
jgi:CheY-like chemotaxis protein